METFVSLAIPVKQQFISFRFGASNTSVRFVSFRFGGGGSKLWSGIKDFGAPGSLIPVEPVELPLMGAREAPCGNHEGELKASDPIS